MSLRDHLQAVHDRHGELTPELVVNEARPESHPLHDHFEWNNTAAGDAWRKHQAAALIRSVKITYREATETEEARTVRAYHAIRGPNGHAYRPAEEIAVDPFMKQLVLNDMRRDWLALRRRYESFSEFLELVRNDMEEAA